ncbi:MAG: DUF4942 domain-containing protein [Streptococcaceae bacterium]|jgi:phospholipid N-methyltransferase|nr:DUF4942 domain-containing protein [Streptococcaceae bacterium]
MFNKDFFPTPKNVLNEWLKDFKAKKGVSILEASAGKGDILEYILEHKSSEVVTVRNKVFNHSYDRKDFDIDAIEIEPELQSILKGKGFRVVHNDFLTYHTNKRYDYIIMNPPFSEGDKHLLKAIDLMKDGGKIFALLNAETLLNPFSNNRKDLLRKLEEYQTDIEYLDNSFIDAERKTGVKVAMIRLDIPKRVKKSLFYEDMKKAYNQQEKEQAQKYHITTGNFIAEFVRSYNLEVQAGVRLLEEFSAFKLNIQQDSNSNRSLLKMDLYNEQSGSFSEVSVNEYIRNVRAKYWDNLFNNRKFTEKLTENLKRDLVNDIHKFVDYEFSEYNIYNIQLELSKNLVEGVENTIIELFDSLSYVHSYDEFSKNTHLFNGWKTNKSWFINKKVIIPSMNFWVSEKLYGSEYLIQRLSDIEKSLNYLNGNQPIALNVRDVLIQAKENDIFKKVECEFFYLTFFKKGTCHLEFKDMELLARFNRFASQGKGWLPPSYSKKSYNDMTREEQEVINEFEGEAEYRKFYERSSSQQIGNGNEMLRIAV